MTLPDSRTSQPAVGGTKSPGQCGLESSQSQAHQVGVWHIEDLQIEAMRTE